MAVRPPHHAGTRRPDPAALPIQAPKSPEDSSIAALSRTMISPGQEFAALLSQYDQSWLEHVARFEQKLQLLQTLKQGVELLLLVSSFLFYYLIDCVAQIMALPIIR